MQTLLPKLLCKDQDTVAIAQGELLLVVGHKVLEVILYGSCNDLSTCLFIPGVQGTVPGARTPPSPTQEGAFQQFSEGFWGDSRGKTDSF